MLLYIHRKEINKEDAEMKKYNLSTIMKRAWELVKKAGMTISAGLKKAWKEAKNMTKALEDFLMENGGKRWIKKNEDGSVAQDSAAMMDIHFRISFW